MWVPTNSLTSKTILLVLFIWKVGLYISLSGVLRASNKANPGNVLDSYFPTPQLGRKAKENSCRRPKHMEKKKKHSVCVCVYIHIHINTYIYTYVCIHIHLYTYTYTHTYHIYLYTYIFIPSPPNPAASSFQPEMHCLEAIHPLQPKSGLTRPGMTLGLWEPLPAGDSHSGGLLWWNHFHWLFNMFS